jgi:hypothetical protein
MRSTAATAFMAGVLLVGQAGKDDCDRYCLIDFADRYLTAMVAHDASKAPMAKGVKFTENTAELPFTEGLWYTATGLGNYKLYIADPQAGQVGFIGIVKEHDRPVLLALRLKVSKRRITEAESIVARSPSEKALANLTVPRAAFSEKLAPAERRSRAELVRITNLYFDGIEQVTASIVPFDPECNRMENGARSAGPPADPDASPRKPAGSGRPGAGAGPRMMTCVDGFNSGINAIITSITPRRVPIVDEETGVTFGLFMFNHKGLKTITMRDGTVRNGASNGQPFSVAMAEVFKIKNGKIRDVEAVGSKVPYRLKFGWE